jgi:hypothetical protein
MFSRQKSHQENARIKNVQTTVTTVGKDASSHSAGYVKSMDILTIGGLTGSHHLNPKTTSNNSLWIADTGASKHHCNDLSMFSEWKIDY